MTGTISEAEAGGTMPSAVPLTVLTGFLGSGKTTLLKALLADPNMAGTAVIINEIGEIGLDDALVEKAEEDAVLLPSGCVCCAVKDDLVEALVRLHRRSLDGDLPALRRVVLETTGLADPGPIAQTLIGDRDVFRIYQLDGVVTTVDAEHGLGQIAEHYEPARQIAVADRLVVTKTDRVERGAIEALEARLRTLNPTADLIEAVKGDIDAERLFGIGAYEIARTGVDPEEWLEGKMARGATAVGHAHGAHHGHDHAGDHGHDHTHYHTHDHTHDHHCADEGCSDPSHGHLHGISTFALTWREPLEGGRLSMALQTLAMAYGQKLLRLKGIVDVAGMPQPFVVHGVQHTFYPPDTLSGWPEGDKRSRMVFITKDLSREVVAKHLTQFLGPPA